MVFISAAGFVPIAFVDRDHFARMAGDAAVGEEVRRVGEDEVDGVVGDVFEDLEAVTMVEADVVFGVVKSGSGEARGKELEMGLDTMMINGDSWSDGYQSQAEAGERRSRPKGRHYIRRTLRKNG